MRLLEGHDGTRAVRRRPSAGHGRKAGALLAMLALAVGVFAAAPGRADPLPPGQCEAGFGFPGTDDANNSIGAATAMSSPTACAGAINSSGDQDWYKFEVGAGDHIVAAVRPLAAATFDLKLYDPSNASRSDDSIAPTRRVCATDPAASECTMPGANPAGSWRLEVIGRLGGTGGPYLLSIAVVSQSAVSCESAGDAGNAQGSPTELKSATSVVVPTPSPSPSPSGPTDVLGSAPGFACTGDLSSGDVADWYVIPVKDDGSTIVAILVPLGTDPLSASLVDPSGNDVTNAPLIAQVGPAAPTCKALSAPTVCARLQAAKNGTSPNVWRVGIKPVTAGERYLLLVAVVGQIPGIPPVAPSCEGGTDAGNDENNPTAAPGGSLDQDPDGFVAACQGELSTSADKDWYKFPVEVDDSTITVALNPLGTVPLKLEFMDPNGVEVSKQPLLAATGETLPTCNPVGQAVVCHKSQAVKNDTGSNVWRVGISAPSEAVESYALVIRVDGPKGPSCEPGGDAGDDTSGTAKPAPQQVVLPSPPDDQYVTFGACKGGLPASDNQDNYTITLDRSDTKAVEVVVSPLSVESLRVCIAPPGMPETCDGLTPGQAGAPRVHYVVVSVPPLTGPAQMGVWTIKVKHVSDARGDYALQLTTLQM